MVQIHPGTVYYFELSWFGIDQALRAFLAEIYRKKSSYTASLCGAISLCVRLLTERLVVQIHPGTVYYFELSLFGIDQALRAFLAEIYRKNPATQQVSVAQSVSAFGC